MGKLALLACSPEIKKPVRKRKWNELLLEHIKEWIEKLVPKLEPECQLVKMEPVCNSEIFLIKLPYSLSQLTSLQKNQIDGVNRFISQGLLDNNLEFCILPAKIADIHMFSRCVKNPFPVERLFKPLFRKLLEEIYTKKGIEIGALDIAIVHGQNVGELSGFLRLLCEQCRFITLIAEDKDTVEQVVNELYDETGLAVRVTSDWRSGLKNADLIINFRDNRGGDLELRYASGAVLINFGGIDAGRIKGDNVIINGLEIKLPKIISDKLDFELGTFFNSSELAGILLGNSLSTEAEELSRFSFAHPALAMTVTQKFISDGYRITGVMGRRNIVKLREIKIS